MKSEAVLAFDIGGTNLRVAPLTRDGRLLADPSSTELNRSEKVRPELLIEKVAGLVHAFKAKGLRLEIVGLGVCSPGIVDAEEGRVIYARNLNFRNTKIVEPLEDLTGLPATLENDAKAAAYGELRYGAARGVKDFVYVTVGTGLGGAIIVNGQIYRGAHGAAGEVGHMSINVNGREDRSCGGRGCLQLYASGRGMQEASGLPMEGIVEGARRGDPGSERILSQAAKSLACALVSLANTLDPSMIVIGGGLMGRIGDLWLPEVRSWFEKRLPPYIPCQIELRKAELYHKRGDDVIDISGITGVAALAFERLGSDSAR